MGSGRKSFVSIKAQQHEQQLQIVSIPSMVLDTAWTSPSSAQFLAISRASCFEICSAKPFCTRYLPSKSKCRQVLVSCLQLSSSGSRFFLWRQEHVETLAILLA